jgi:hypothetical protein
MRRRILKRLRVVTLTIACLAMGTPAWAQGGITFQSLGVYLEGVNRYGCLTDCGGECATFCALLNTCTGLFIGTAEGCVCNQSCCPEFYYDVNFFNECCCVNVIASVYTVSKCGSACYIAIGCEGAPPESED